MQLTPWATPLPWPHPQSRAKLTQKSDPKWTQGGGLYSNQRGREASQCSLCVSTIKCRTDPWKMEMEAQAAMRSHACLSNNLFGHGIMKMVLLQWVTFSPLQKLLLISGHRNQAKTPALSLSSNTIPPSTRDLIKWNISLFRFVYPWSWSCHLEWVLGSGRCWANLIGSCICSDTIFESLGGDFRGLQASCWTGFGSCHGKEVIQKQYSLIPSKVQFGYASFTSY